MTVAATGKERLSPLNTRSAERHHHLLKVGEFGRCAYGKVMRDYRGRGRGGNSVYDGDDHMCAINVVLVWER